MSVSPQMETVRPSSIVSDVPSCDTTLVFVVKSLLYPVTTVLVLLICVSLSKQVMIGPYFLVAVLAFAGVAELIDFSALAAARQNSFSFNSFKYVASRWLLLAASISIITYLSGVDLAINDPTYLSWVIVTPVVLWLVHLAVWGPLYQFGMQRTQPRSAVIVGASHHGLMLSRTLASQPMLRINCMGFFADSVTHSNDSSSDNYLPVLGTTAELPTYVRDNNIQLVYITLPLSRDPVLLKLLKALHNSVASVYFVPDLGGLNLIAARLDVVHGIPLIAICESPFYGAKGLTKRCSDIVLSSLIILLIAPLLILIAIGIKLSSPGPVIFKQRRYGLDGREIMVYKFRSMTVTEDGAQTYKQVTRNDSRVTPFGQLLRRTSLDELPQFFNVLQGSMSVVGPRPHAVAVNERYREQIPRYMIRHKVKPGITGWAQVNGYRGGDDLYTMSKRIEFDLKYLANWSLWFDLKIIARTFMVVIKDRHAY